MAATIGSSPDFRRLVIKYTDVRGQTATKRININPATSNLAITIFLTALDSVTNAKLSCEVEDVFLVTGTKGSAIDATEANLSEVMAIILQATNPVTGTGRVSATFPIYAMIRAIENFPDGSLDTANINIVAVNAFLNTNLEFKDSAAALHVGLLQVQPLDSQHITEEDVVDRV